MDLGLTLLSLTRAVGFKTEELFGRSLQEAGVSPLRVFALHRYAFIAGIIWSVIFIRANDITQILHSPLLLFYILACVLLWNIQVALSFYVLNMTSSMTSLSTIHYLCSFPLLLLIGTFFNHDIPNVFSIVGIAALMVAIVIQPAHHTTNVRARYTKPFILIFGIILLKTFLEAIGAGFDREILKIRDPAVFLGIFCTLTLGVCWLWTSRLPQQLNDNKIIQQKAWLAAAIPILWFTTSIAEYYAQAALPNYTLFAIGAIAFAMDTVSDLFQRRIRFNMQTATFIIFVVAGVSITIYSI